MHGSHGKRMLEKPLQDSDNINISDIGYQEVVDLVLKP